MISLTSPNFEFKSLTPNRGNGGGPGIKFYFHDNYGDFLQISSEDDVVE